MTILPISRPVDAADTTDAAKPPVMLIAGAPDPGPIPASDAPHENNWYDGRDFGGYRVTEAPAFGHRRRLRVVCIGAGAAGIQLAYKAERALREVDLQIYEKNGDVGGTWLENRYPGCTCDIPSHAYQFTWARNPEWSAYYASSEEIWTYMKGVTTRFGLAKYMRFNTRVESAVWDEEKGKWRLTMTRTTTGDASEARTQTTENDECDILIGASGILNSWKYPDIAGLDTFRGKLMHSAQWDGRFDLTNKKVAVIGGGSSAVQIIPSIQPAAAKLVAFLRSPVWITTGFGAKYAGPGGTNFQYSEEQLKELKEDPAAFDKYCRDVEGELNKRFNLMHLHAPDQQKARILMEGIMRDKLGPKGQALATHLIPPFAVGCRRMTPGADYLESLTRDNVEVVHESVVKLTETGVVDAQGKEHPVDVVVCATGFDTSFAPPYRATGRNGADLKAQFGDAPRGYLGITVENFPNFFLLPGPNSPASHSSLLPILDWYTRYTFQMIDKVQTDNIKSFAPKPKAVHDLYNHTHELMKRLVWSSACRSWFKNGKTHGPVTAIYPGSRLHFFEVLKNVRWEDYELEYGGNGNCFQFMGNGYTQVEADPNGDPVWYFDDPFVKM
ncbi:hypothetical protein SEUCBS139899_001974 [Sporothrix eucalyptigena]